VTSTDITHQVAAIARSDGGRLLAVLTGLLKNLELAEDCLQDAYASALSHWARGAPANPSAWLLQVARRKAIDRLRRVKTARAKEGQLTRLLQIEADAPEQDENYTIPDERLKLIFVCCHPAIERDASVALTLRSLCGITTEEIARAFLVTRETMAQRLVRAQQKITKAKILFEVPDPHHWPERMEAVLSVIYLIFNEGYASSSPDYIRASLCEEAIRLARVIWQLAPQENEAAGLLALMLLHRSRFATRRDEEGVLVPLEFQDRSKWNRTLIAEATSLLEQVLRRGKTGPYQLQAAIAAIHCEAESFSSMNWREIVLIYNRLLELTPNPVVELNRLVALSYAENAATALIPFDALETELAGYQPFHAAKADLLSRAGDVQKAALAYEKAISLSNNEAERKFLLRRFDELNAQAKPR
jgi:RNA polymerase sigma-70 factor, ECF subfamily